MAYERKIGIRRKGGQPHEFILVVNPGQVYRLPKNITAKDIETVIIGVPDQQELPPLIAARLEYTQQEEHEVVKKDKHRDIVVKDEDIDPRTVKHGTPTSRDCSKCGGTMFSEVTCCTERNAGFISKWICDQCRHVIYKKSKSA